MEDIPLPINETSTDDNSIIYTATDALMDIIIFLVIIANLLIVLVIAINKRLQTRTYWILLNWAINDTLFLILIALREVMVTWMSGCLLVHIDYLFPLNCNLLMLMIVCNTLINGDYSLKIILGITYVTTFLLLTGFTFLCMSMQTLMPGFGVVMLSAFVLFIVVLVKECNKCRKMKSEPLRAKTVFRLNLARIFVYNFIIVIFLYILFDKAIESRIGAQLCMFSFLLAPVYELIYLICADENFKRATLNVFKSSTNKVALDMDMNVTDDDIQPTSV